MREAQQPSGGCPVCRSSATVGFLRREQVPVQQNLLVGHKDRAIGMARGDLDLVLCLACGFAFNRAFDPNKFLYGEPGLARKLIGHGKTDLRSVFCIEVFLTKRNRTC